jgi:hypothetical protein
MQRAGVFLRCIRETIDLPVDADCQAVMDRLMERGAEAGFTGAELAKLRSELAKRLVRDRQCVT